HGIQCIQVAWPLDEEDDRPQSLDLIRERVVDLVINIPKDLGDPELDNGYLIRRQAVDFGVPLLTNPQSAALLADALARNLDHGLECLPWESYIGG
ncbi:MAG: hypothetical protein QGH45_09000, partial [Myxococcota bacterium]|nr:hypothetical protein [Myxococcota bacterium]